MKSVRLMHRCVKRAWPLGVGAIAIALVLAYGAHGEQPGATKKTADELDDLPDMLDELEPKPNDKPSGPPKKKETYPEGSIGKLIQRARDIDTGLTIFSKSDADRAKNLRRWVASELQRAATEAKGRGKSSTLDDEGFAELVDAVAQEAERQPGESNSNSGRDSRRVCAGCLTALGPDGQCPVCHKPK